MKRKWIALICLLMILCMLPLEGMAIRYGNVVRITNANAVNVRRGPGTGYGVMGEVQPKNLYVHLGTVDGWECILYQGEEGYVAGNRVTVERGLVPDEFGDGDFVEAIVRVTHGNALNVRSGPGTQYDKIGKLPKGEVVDVMVEGPGNWYYIDDDGDQGYVDGRYLRRIEPSEHSSDEGDQSPSEPDQSDPGPLRTILRHVGDDNITIELVGKWEVYGIVGGSD